MNIKKIIQEEISDFDWVGSIEEPDLFKTLELALKDTTFPVFVKKLYRRGQEMVVIQDELGNSFTTFSMDRIKRGEITFNDIIKEFERNCEMPWEGDVQTKREYCEIYSSLLEYKKNLTESIKLKEDFDWIDSVPELPLGEHFTVEDINDKFFIKDGEIVYKLDWEEFDELVTQTDGYWSYIKESILSNGTYVEEYSDDYFDDYEINYLPSYLDDPREDRLRKAITKVYEMNGIKLSDDDLDRLMTEEFLSTEKYIGRDFYSGSNDFDDFTSLFMGHVSDMANRNRWINLNEIVQKTIEKAGFKVIGNYSRETVLVTTSYPYKHVRHMKDEGEMIGNVTEILTKGLEYHLSGDWAEVFYDDFDTRGREEQIRSDFDKFIENIEDTIKEKEGNL